MATSGSYNTTDVGSLGSSPDRMRFEWSLSSQNENGNYSIINWNVRGWGGASSSWWTQNFGSTTTINGVLVQSTGSFQMYHNTIFGSGQRTIGHGSSGTKTFSASSTNKIYWNTSNSSGSGSWSLPSLYQEIAYNTITVTAVSDIAISVYCSVNRTADLLQLSINGGGWTTYHSGNFTSKTVTVGGASSPLVSGQQYSIKLRVRRDSNANITDSGTYYATTDVQNKFFGIGDY